jgi:broad specificity phosphatase PhoE
VKPENIILVRHGQSHANVDRSICESIPDYALQLTSLGRKQAVAAGEQIRSLIQPGTPIQFYISPYWRTRQTFEEIAKKFPKRSIRAYEDPRLREQEWGNDYLQAKGPTDYAALEDRRDGYGHFYFALRESCADVFDRVSDIIGTMHRDFKKPTFPPSMVIVTHGMTMRVFLMRWFHLTVEEFELMANPLNGELYILRRRAGDEHYDLVTEPRRHKLKHKFQYKFKYRFTGWPTNLSKDR